METPENQPSARSGWVLAGGRSSRMGRDKALISVGETSLAARVAQIIRPVSRSVTLVGDPARYSPLNLPAIPDNFPGLGPLSGIEAALSATTTDWNLVVACDMPSLDAATLEQLFETAESSPANCIVPQHPDGSLEPLCAVYHRRCHPFILDAISQGVRKVTAALPPETLRYLQVRDARSFANLNTPEELRKYRDG